MIIEGAIYNNNGNRICEFIAFSKDALANYAKDFLTPQNEIRIKNDLDKVDSEKIIKLYETICEMI